MMCIGIVLVSGNLYTIDGGSQSLLVPRSPFYGQQEYCDIHINLISPVDSETYWNTNVLVNTSGTTGATNCYYSSGGDWNSIACDFEDTRTFQSGEVVFIFRAENGLCSVEESVTFTVVDFVASLVGDLDLFLFIPIVLGIFIIVCDDDEASYY